MPQYRLDVPLTPSEVRIFDIIARCGRTGIEGQALHEMVGKAPATVHVHIYNINQKFEDTGHRIQRYRVGRGFAFYVGKTAPGAREGRGDSRATTPPGRPESRP